MAEMTNVSVKDALGEAYELPVRMFGIVDDSIVDGPGLRFSVFVQGCSHECPGCHNEGSWDPCGGYPDTVGHVCELIAASHSITGVTLTGGEPFEQPEACLAIARWCKGHGLNVWAYTGHLYEAIERGDLGDAASDLLKECDVVVDGPFVQSQFSHDLKWKGSRNQRVIDATRTRDAGEIVLREPGKIISKTPDLIRFEIPDNW